VVLAFCLLEYVLYWEYEVFREYAAFVLSLGWGLMLCLLVWCGAFLVLTFRWSDLALIGFLIDSVLMSVFVRGTRIDADLVVLLFSVTFGKAVKLVVQTQIRKLDNIGAYISIRVYFIGLISLLAIGACFSSNEFAVFYHGPRWVGLWNNPNIYGMLMSAGIVLALALFVTDKSCGVWTDSETIAKSNVVVICSDIMKKLLPVCLLAASGMMGVGLFCSYSRGAWIGTCVGLLYLAWSCGNLKWRYILLVGAVLVAVVYLFWDSTPDSASWYVKRLDFGRPSAQHRIAAWRGALQMMWDHPLGVGWGRAVEVYAKDYSPPEGSAAAISTNDYLMLGTQLGWPGLVCFLAYVALCFRKKKARLTSLLSSSASFLPSRCGDKGLQAGMQLVKPLPPFCLSLSVSHRIACRSAVLAMLIAFWFDYGLFTLATGALFWAILELGNEE
jgi:hypothetical protein